jgi:hypothetical protein
MHVFYLRKPDPFRRSDAPIRAQIQHFVQRDEPRRIIGILAWHVRVSAYPGPAGSTK